MQTITTNFYSIYFKEFDAYKILDDYLNNNSYSSIFIIVDENTKRDCIPVFLDNTNIPISNTSIIEIKAGEKHKNLDTCKYVWEELTDLKADRNSLIINLGGGLVTDLGGFVASTFKRGIDFINIPTTLLAMVDASVGGKTGVDLGVLKNQIGLFSYPKMVIIDSTYLDTLSKREINSGIAEIIKHGLIYDKSVYQQITTIDPKKLIYRSIEIKNDIVSKDPKEKGLRKVLNFGHTIGHAIESYFLKHPTYETLTHGEAIAIGIVCACYISSKLLNFSFEKTNQIKEKIISIFGKKTINISDFTPIIDLLKHDKKNSKNEVNFTLLYDIENFKINCKVSNSLITESIKFYNQ